MPPFGSSSLSQLATCDARLQRVMNATAEVFNFSVLEGHRGKEAQDKAYLKGLSQKPWPLGNHNSIPSRACDVAPFPIDWSNKESARERFVLLAGFVLCTAKQLDIPLRWGGDWDGDLDTRDEHFRDLGHFEVID